MQYSIISSDSHATQSFTQLEQGLDELLDEYLHHMGGLLSKLYHTSEISRILVEGLNHYAMGHGLNCRKLQDSVVGHQSVQWKMMEEHWIWMS